MSDWLVFLTHNWLLLLIVVLIIGALISGLFKLFSILVVAALIMVFFFGYSPNEVLDMAKNSYNNIYSKYESEWKPDLDAELDNAVVEKNTDGSYTIKTATFTIYGKEGGNDVNIVHDKFNFNMNLNLLGSEIAKKIQDIQVSNAEQPVPTAP